MSESANRTINHHPKSEVSSRWLLARNRSAVGRGRQKSNGSLSSVTRPEVRVRYYFYPGVCRRNCVIACVSYVYSYEIFRKDSNFYNFKHISDSPERSRVFHFRFHTACVRHDDATSIARPPIKTKFDQHNRVCSSFSMAHHHNIHTSSSSSVSSYSIERKRERERR